VRALVQQHLQQVMRQQALSSMSPANLASEWLDMQELARHTPQHMAAILRTLAENRLRVRIDGLEESRMMESMQKIANRVATGLIIAALVVGAALTARIQLGGHLFGLPYLSVLFLGVAALLGISLLLSALRRDRMVERPPIADPTDAGWGDHYSGGSLRRVLVTAPRMPAPIRTTAPPMIHSVGTCTKVAM